MPRKKTSSSPHSRNIRIRGDLRPEPDLQKIAMTVLDQARFLTESNQTPEQAALAKSIHSDTIATLTAMGIKAIKDQPLPHCTCQTCWRLTHPQT